MYRKLSNGISWALHPFLLPLYMIGVLLTLTVFAHYPSGVKIYLLWVVALYAIIIPLLALGVLRSLGRISDYRIDDRRERLLALVGGGGWVPAPGRNYRARRPPRAASAAAGGRRVLCAVRHYDRQNSLRHLPA